MQEPQLAKIDISTDGKIIVSRKPICRLRLSIQYHVLKVIWQEIIWSIFQQYYTKII